MQMMTGSAGASYRWYGNLFSTSVIYGSGQRTGDLSDGVAPNSLSTPPYVVVNAGVSREIRWSADSKPMTLRFDIVNLLDKPYVICDGSGIGVFAPQFGARRGFYVGVSQKL